MAFKQPSLPVITIFPNVCRTVQNSHFAGTLSKFNGAVSVWQFKACEVRNVGGALYISPPWEIISDVCHKISRKEIWQNMVDVTKFRAPPLKRPLLHRELCLMLQICHLYRPTPPVSSPPTLWSKKEERDGHCAMCVMCMVFFCLMSVWKLQVSIKMLWGQILMTLYWQSVSLCTFTFFWKFFETYCVTQPYCLVGRGPSRVFWLINPLEQLGAGCITHGSCGGSLPDHLLPFHEEEEEQEEEKIMFQIYEEERSMRGYSHKRRGWMRAYGRRVVSRAVKSEPSSLCIFLTWNPVQM